MAMICFNCKKGVMAGLSHTHHPGVAGGRWKKRAPKTIKVFKPNLHYTRIMVDKTPKRVRLCTKCLRIFKKKQSLKTLPKTSIPTSVSVSV